ncbi:MAG: type I DNA topoisomerase [Acidobacteria bacterium]|nr:type I DNA topoisomerase [Acidobacteriota bacterium]
MASKLLIVESPAKARTIGKFLGKEFVVKASVGHVRDLPKSKLGVDEANGYLPEYEILPDKAKIVQELKRAAKNAEEIYLAADPDREGEAICWHLAEILESAHKPIHRVEFHEITRRAIRDAFEHPRAVDMTRVNAQQARRVIDRLVGYRLSPLLWDKVKRGLSAGRVQSVALKMICDREAEIEAFEPEEYWLVDARVSARTPPPFVVRLAKKNGRKWRPGKAEEAKAVEAALREGPLTVAKVSRRTGTQRPRSPFITSHLQQAAARRLRLPVRRTMRLAQRLYEGIDLGDRGRLGLITYMRTDSVRVASEAVAAARDLIARKWGPGALPAKPNVFKNRSSAQDAHEAIRPTNVELTPDEVAAFLKPDELRLYRMIWERFVSSQMRPATFDVTQIEVTAGPYTLAVTGKVMRDPGFLKVWRENSDAPSGPEAAKLPDGIESGQELTLEDVILEQKQTQPPPRFTEGTLVKALEENGIGRPSTYATIIATISGRDYVVKQKGTFRPTELGKLVTRLLTGSFARIINESYTASLEEDLDRVAGGEENWQELVRSFAVGFEAELERAKVEMEQVKGKGVATSETCPKCAAPLVIKFGRYGEFLACTNYPTCTYTRDLEDEAEKAGDAEEEAPTCPECEAPMVKKRSRFGPFWACSRYPECKGTRRIGKAQTSAPPKPTGVPCPREGCDGEIVARISRRGRTFYGCNRYPKCDFVMWDHPVQTPCPECGFPIMGLHVTKRRGRELICPVKSCGHREPAPEEPGTA